MAIKRNSTVTYSSYYAATAFSDDQLPAVVHLCRGRVISLHCGGKLARVRWSDHVDPTLIGKVEEILVSRLAPKR